MVIQIDLGAAAHRLRRWWWRFARYKVRHVTRCYDCGRRLTDEERRYYVCTCERCEGLQLQRVEHAEAEEHRTRGGSP